MNECLEGVSSARIRGVRDKNEFGFFKAQEANSCRWRLVNKGERVRHEANDRKGSKCGGRILENFKQGNDVT